MSLKKQCLGVVGVAFLLITASSHANSRNETFFNNSVVTPALILAGQTGEVLGGDAGSACEMLLCLAAVGSAPSACKEPLKKYFSMKPKRRAGFLSKCPKVSS